MNLKGGNDDERSQLQEEPEEVPRSAFPPHSAKIISLKRSKVRSFHFEVAAVKVIIFFVKIYSNIIILLHMEAMIRQAKKMQVPKIKLSPT